MGWFSRSAPPLPPPTPEPGPASPVVLEGAAPGVAALFEGISRDGIRAVLDLGPATGAKLEVYGRFARWVRFADLLGHRAPPGGWAEELSALRRYGPFDLVLAWDILDRLPPDGRPLLAPRLVELTTPSARLHVVVEASQGATDHPRRFTLLDVDRMRYEAEGPHRSSAPRLASAEVGRLLAPFRVDRAFTLKAGVREYVAMRTGG